MLSALILSTVILGGALARTLPLDPTLDRHGRIVNGNDADADAW
jgi:hypothetical protein